MCERVELSCLPRSVHELSKLLQTNEYIHIHTHKQRWRHGDDDDDAKKMTTRPNGMKINYNDCIDLVTRKLSSFRCAESVLFRKIVRQCIERINDNNKSNFAASARVNYKRESCVAY